MSTFVIQVMENLQSLENLQELWLGQNRIKVVNLCGLKCIKKISFQSNRLTSMTGFEVCPLPIIPCCGCPQFESTNLSLLMNLGIIIIIVNSLCTHFVEDF